MQSPDEKERNAKLMYLLGRVLFVVFMLIALDGMHQAWKVTHGWNHRYELVAPWVFLGITGLAIWTNTSRKKLDQNLAGGLLMIIGFSVQYAYEAMGRLASTHF